MMILHSSALRAFAVAVASIALSVGPSAATALLVAQTPTISGNGWVALGILGGFVGAVYMMIAGALHVERRDARLGRRPYGDEHGWFGMVRSDDDDAPDVGNGDSNGN